MKAKNAAAAFKASNIHGWNARNDTVHLKPLENHSDGWKFREATYIATTGQTVNIYTEQPAIGPGIIRMGCVWNGKYRQAEAEFPDPVNLSRESLRRAAKVFADRVRRSAK